MKKFLMVVLAVIIIISFATLARHWTPGAMTVGGASSGPSAAQIQQDAADHAERLRVAAGAVTLANASRNPKAVQWVSVVATTDGAVCYTLVTQNAFGGPVTVQAIMPPKSTQVVAGNAAGKAWETSCAGHGGFDYTWLARKATT